MCALATYMVLPLSTRFGSVSQHESVTLFGASEHVTCVLFLESRARRLTRPSTDSRPHLESAKPRLFYVKVLDS